MPEAKSKKRKAVDALDVASLVEVLMPKERVCTRRFAVSRVPQEIHIR